MAEPNEVPAAPEPASKPNASPKNPAPKATAKKNAAPKKPSTPKAVVKAKPSKGEEVKAKVKKDMNDFKSKAADTARATAEKGKDRATEAVGSIGKLIRDSAATIDENVGKEYGNYARSAADAVEGFASKLDAKDVDAIAEDARQFVRKSPAVAIGAAAAIGFVLARLVRSGGKDA